jgi:hypothetical protein
MKKLLGIVVLGLLWCNGVLADQKTEALTLFILVIGGNIY